MKTVILTGLIVAMQMHPSPTSAGSGDGFSLVKSAEGVMLYERWITRANQSAVREVKAVFTAVAHPHQVIRLLKDGPRGKQWNSNALEYKVEHTTSPHAWSTYIRYDLPWPMDDQDGWLLYHCEMQQGLPMVVHFSSAPPGQHPVYDNITRVHGTRGRWEIEPAGDAIRVTYIVSTERSSTIPRWMSDPLVQQHLVKTMQKFKAQLEQYPPMN